MWHGVKSKNFEKEVEEELVDEDFFNIPLRPFFEDEEILGSDDDDSEVDSEIEDSEMEDIDDEDENEGLK
ncbi:hypothetical protein HK096_001022, partial [Nowakowskiella sp. JEL0078]